MNLADQKRADAANDSYFNRSQSEVGKPKPIHLGGADYTVFGYANDPITGFHATAYRSVEVPHNIIIAYRGTDPGLFTGETKAEKASHALTTVQDIAVDATMVRDAVNPQKAAADAFTAQMLAKAAARGIPKDHVTVAGHSLGGALAQIEAAEFGLRGATFNAYGAVSLRHHVPEGGTAVTNYVLAGDPVSAASRHYGTVVTLATPENVQALKDAHYLDVSHGASSPNPLRAMRLGDHSGTHFTGPQSVLSPERLAQLQANYAHNKAAFDHFRQDVHQDRELLNMALNPGAITTMAAKAEALAVQVRAEHAYDAGRQTVERGIHAVEHTAGQAYDTLTHPEQWFQHSGPTASMPPTSTNADTSSSASSSSSSSSSSAASTPPPAMDRHTGQQDDHAFQQRQEHIRQAQQQAVQLAQAYRQTQPPPAHSVPVHEKPASVDMQEQARIAQLQQHEQQAQAAREQQHHLAQQHAQLHRQAMEAQQREHEQHHNQAPRSPAHEQRQAGEPMLYTPPTRPPRSDEHLQDFRQPDHPMHSRYTQFKNALEQSHTLPINGDKLPYGPAQQERLAAGFTDALGIDPHYEHSIRGFKQHQGQLLAYDQPCSFTEKSHVLRIDPEQALAKSPEQHAANWKAREASHPELPSRVIAPITITAEDMRHPAHPRHAMFEQARSAIANANERWGRPTPDPEQLDRHAAHVVVESRKFGHTEVERVHLGMPQGYATQTPNYAVQSEGRIVARIFAPELKQAPDVAQASQQLQTVEQQNLAEQQAMQAQRAAQMQGQGMVMKL
ncbi:XVIPCD domain-containing protein [Xanthomonas albilineans]|uniref:XVIPCD domain-containing protein n=1 Tax=Xanthomonas albilineans TaxID=29447 RepID=UPI000AB179A8|nr:XVIPCD domain-containing protein [Xanthomonas albilineans]